MTVIVGLLGPAGSGKSTVAKYLCERYGAKRYSLAGPLKQFAKRVFGFTDEQLYGTQAQKEAPDERFGGFSARWFLQHLGTEGFRNTFGEDFWLDHMLKTIAKEKPDLAVCDDVRFPNEATGIRRWAGHSISTGYGQSGLVWRLEPPEYASSADSTHASEAQWKQCEYDRLIKPDVMSLDLLYSLVDEACRHYHIMPVTKCVGY